MSISTVAACNWWFFAHRRSWQRFRRTCIESLTLVFLTCQFASNGWAQNYPAKAIRYIVASGPGSGTDTIGRIVAQGMSDVLAQQVFVDNRAGAAANLAPEIAARAAPDGYTVLQASQTHAINASLYSKLAYDLVRDFAPVTLLASSASVVVTHPSVPVKSIPELVKLAKAKPGALNYASAGVGTATFLAAELFKAQAGIDLYHVPYRSGGDTLIALMSGEVSVYFGPFASALPFIRQGRLRALAVTTPKRLSSAPDYPTVAESGYPDYQAGNWYGIVVPAKTPKDFVSTLHAATIKALNNPSVNKRLTDLGYLISGNQPDEFAALMKSDIETLAKVLRATGVKPR